MCEITGFCVISRLTVKAVFVQKSLPAFFINPPPNPATSCTAPYLSTITLTLHFWLFLFVCEFCLNSCVASQFPWQQRWNCWTCTVKANTVMGLLKAQSGEEELWSGCSCCIGCLLEWGGAEGKRERERQSVEEALVERYEMPVSCVCR